MKRFYILLLALFASVPIYAQTPNNIFPYSYQFYQKLNKSVYNKDTRFHSALKPYFIDDSLIKRDADSVLSYGIDTSRKSWLGRKIFNEHLINIKDKDYSVYADFLPDLLIGNDFSNKRSTWLNTRGYQVGGTFGNKLSFYTSGYENQGKFAKYYSEYARRIQVVPGQGFDRKHDGGNTEDWSYVTALLSYTPVKYLNVTLGQDKLFIGDGYRSMLLSDVAANYPFLKLTANLGNVQYSVAWAGMRDPGIDRLSYQSGFRRKGAVFHYLDWNVSKKFSLGFFDAVIWSETDSAGNRRGFDFSYANPIVFLRPLEFAAGSPDNALIGFNFKYEVFNKTTVYSQFLLDEFVASDFFSNPGDYKNKWGWQLGFRGADLFKVQSLNYLFEFNTARPYTYSEQDRMISYSQFDQPLAHPFGANFGELLGILNYSKGRFSFSGQFNFGHYGLDPDELSNYGKDIFKTYTSASKQSGNFIGQGITTDLYYTDARISFLLNPKNNLRIELGGVYRNEKNDYMNSKTSWLTFGLRSSFRNLYQDF